jgi:serine protease
MLTTLAAVLPLVALAGGTPALAAASDPLRAEQYALDQSRFPGAWRSTTGEGVVVAVVDTGVDVSHPDLAGRLVPGVDLVDGGEPDDGNGHGTHVAGIAVAVAGNGIGTAGAAPSAKVMPVRVLDDAGSGSAAVIAHGIGEAVAKGADVVNLSLGGSGLSARLLKGGEINQAIRAASEQGVVVVAAAGNEGNALRSYRFGVPVLVVNAVDENGALAEFSNYADSRAVSAGGVDIVSTVPRTPTTLFPDGTNGYAKLSGTSMSAPLVAGQAALLLAQGRSAASTIEAITATAQPSADARLGAGIADAQAAVELDIALEDRAEQTPAPSTSTASSATELQGGAGPGTRLRDRADDSTTPSWTSTDDASASAWSAGWPLVVAVLITVGSIVAVRFVISGSRAGRGRDERTPR